jgi:hypothetical protein
MVNAEITESVIDSIKGGPEPKLSGQHRSLFGIEVDGQLHLVVEDQVLTLPGATASHSRMPL